METEVTTGKAKKRTAKTVKSYVEKFREARKARGTSKEKRAAALDEAVAKTRATAAVKKWVTEKAAPVEAKERPWGRRASRGELKDFFENAPDRYFERANGVGEALADYIQGDAHNLAIGQPNVTSFIRAFFTEKKRRGA